MAFPLAIVGLVTKVKDNAKMIGIGVGVLVFVGLMGYVTYLSSKVEKTELQLKVKTVELSTANDKLEVATEQIATLKQVQAVNDNISALLEEQNKKLELFSNQVFYTLSGDIKKVKEAFKKLPKTPENAVAEAIALSEVRNNAQWVMYCKSNPEHPNCIALTKGVTP